MLTVMFTVRLYGVCAWAASKFEENPIFAAVSRNSEYIVTKQRWKQNTQKYNEKFWENQEK